MKAHNNYIDKIKPQLYLLLSKLVSKYEYASILAIDGVSKSYSVSKSGIFAGENDLFTDRGIVIRVYYRNRYIEYSTNTISEKGILERLDELVAVYDDKPGTSECITDDPLIMNRCTKYKIHPKVYGDNEIISKLDKIYKMGLLYDRFVSNVAVTYLYQEYCKLFISKQKHLEQNVIWSSGLITSSIIYNSNVRSSSKSFCILGGAELLSLMESEINSVTQTALQLINSKPVKPGVYECICAPDVTGVIAHESFGHGVEMDMFVKDRAVAKECIEKKIASSLVTMHDGGIATNSTGSYFFDDEGVVANDTIIIKNGILKKGISDTLTAYKLGTEPTGNGRRESFERKVYTRMTNTYFEPGNDSLDDMIKSIEYGFLLEGATSGMEDPKNWGIQCMINIAREICKGSFTGKIFSPVIITGFVPELLSSISMISNDFVMNSGLCGKGYKEWVEVSDGGPYIKVKVRLG